MGELVDFLEKLVDEKPNSPILQEDFDEKKIGLTPEEMKVIRAEIERYKAQKNIDRLTSILAAKKRMDIPVESNSEMDRLEKTFEIIEEE